MLVSCFYPLSVYKFIQAYCFGIHARNKLYLTIYRLPLPCFVEYAQTDASDIMKILEKLDAF